jgi:uncharacterized membrane protein YbhN (UPF0104 family)
MKSRAVKSLLVVAKFVIPTAIILFLYFNIPAEKWEQLAAQPKNYWLLAAALAVALGAISLSFSRWWLLVRCQKIELSLVAAFRLGAIGYLLSFVSAGSVGGDVFKAIFLARRRPGKSIAAVASVLVDRACGLFGLVMLVAITLMIAPPQAAADNSADIHAIRFWTFAMATVGTGGLLVLVLGGRQVDQFMTRAAAVPIVGPIVAKIGPPLRMFHEHPIALWVALLMSLGVHACFTLSVYLIARGLYIDPPTLAEHYIIVPIGLLASALPITPAGLGIFEGAIHWLYEIVPAEPTSASGVLVALVFQMVKVGVAVIGTIFYWTAGEDVRQSIEQAEQ